MADRRKALGRGLSALLPSTEAGQETVPVNAILPNPHQPRKWFDDVSLAELAESIRRHGVIQPLVLSPLSPPAPTGERYQLVTGERRWRAARLAGLESVPAVIREVSPRECLELALVENLQREDLNPIEAAQAYRELLDQFGLTQEDLAQRVGKSRSAVANSLRLLNLPATIQETLASGAISEGHARALLALPSPGIMERVAEQIVDRGLSVRQTEELVREMLARADPKAPDPETASEEPLVSALEDHLRHRLGTKVELVRGRRGGRMVIHFYSDEELDGLLRIIGVEDL